MMDPGAYFVGALGAFLIFLSWVLLFKELVKGRKIPAEFELLVFFGAVLLTMYAYWLGDVVFTVLNLLVAVFSFLTLEYVPRRTARKRILKRLEEVQKEIERMEVKPVKVSKPRTRKTTTRKTTARKRTTAKKKTTRRTTKKKTGRTRKK